MDDENSKHRISWARLVGIIFGFGNQILFLITVWYLFWFLRDGAFNTNHDFWILNDLALTIVFAVLHSLMLAPSTRSKLKAIIPNAFYGSFFSLVTCICLLALFFGWRTSPIMLWNAQGTTLNCIHACYYLSWIALLYSLALTGLGYQNGWTPFYYWLIQKPVPQRGFQTKGAYKYLRHPVYLSFLGLIWFTPRMSLDHALLTFIWTGYIFVGSVLKDKRLAHYIGNPYREYAHKVPGYPFMLIGPLSRKIGFSQSDRQ